MPMLPLAPPPPAVVDPATDGALSAALAHLEHTPTASVAEVSEVYAVALGRGARHARGAYYTPPEVVSHVLDHTLEPLLDATPPTQLAALRIADPCCGAGHFLLAAHTRLTRRLRAAGHPDPAAAAAACLHGADLDPHALTLTAALFHRLGSTLPTLRRVDSLLDTGAPYDAVIGNPPFQNQLERPTALGRTHAAALKARFPGLVGAYTDPAWLFLIAAVRRTRPGGRIGLVLPRSLVGARDAGPIRAAVGAEARIDGFWDAGAVFPGVGVHVVTLNLTAGAGPGPVSTWVGQPPRPDAVVGPPDGDTWGPLLPAPTDLPRVPAGLLRPGAAVLGDLATTAGDFRDEYYALVPHLHDLAEADPLHFAPLITTGLVDAAWCAWGTRPTRFARTRWTHPRVDLAGLCTSPRFAAWARRRLRPKLLVATQTRALEVVADPLGRWLTGTPLLSVYPHDPAHLWHLAAALLAPLATSWAVEHHGGTALSRQALKLSARQLATVPLPPPGPAWDRAAALVAEAHHGPDRDAALCAAGHALMEAWGWDDPSAWRGWALRHGIVGA